MRSVEQVPSTPKIVGLRKGADGTKRERGLVTDRRVLPREMLQVKERLKGERLPLFVIKDTEQNRRAAEAKPLPGTLVKVSQEGDIFYPVWHERTRILKPELYLPCSKLPRGWSFERLLASKRRPISEIVFHQVRKEGGAVETAIRNMDDILEKFQVGGKELEQVRAVRVQIARAVGVLERTTGVSRKEFDEGFGILYRETLELMEACGMEGATSTLKRDIGRLMDEASTGKDRLDRRNPTAMLKKLQAAARRVEFREAETGFVAVKFLAMKKGLETQRDNERVLLGQTGHELGVFFLHQAFKFPEKEVPKSQEGILIGKLGTLIYRLGHSLVKPYKTVALEAAERLKVAQEKLKSGNYQDAREVVGAVLKKISLILISATNSSQGS